MAGIRINKFAGEMPRVAPRQLDPSAAQVALNCNLNTGSLKSFNVPLQSSSMGTSLIKTIFKLNEFFWLTFAGDTDIVRSPAYNSGDRFFYSDGSAKLKQSDYALASNSGAETEGSPNAYWYLGVPTPATALTATLAGTAGYELEKSVSYVFTYIAQFGSTLRESPPSPVSNTVDVYENQYVALTGLITPVPTEYNIVGYRIYRLETGTSGSNYELLDTLLDVGLEYTTYAATLYDRVNTTFAAGTGMITSSGTTVTGSGTAFSTELAAGDFIIPATLSQARKIVSIASDTEMTIDFAISPDQTSAKAFTYGTAYTLIQDTAEIISSDDYDEPVTGMAGLIELSNGCYAAFIYNRIYISEPFIPDAWPYEVSCNDDIVAIGYYGTTLIAATNTYPYKIEVYDPAAITKQLIPQKQACLFKRSMVSGDRFVIYASPDGLYYIGEDGEKVLTDAIFTKEQWKTLLTVNNRHMVFASTTYDKTIISFLYDNKYFAFFEGYGTGFIIDFSESALQHYVSFNMGNDVKVYGGFVDADKDTLTLIAKKGTTTYYLLQWEQQYRKQHVYSWRSKVFSYPTETSFERAAINGKFTTGVTCKILCDGQTIHTENSIQTSDPFPIKYACGKEWEVIIEGTQEVYEFVMATSMGDLVSLYRT